MGNAGFGGMYWGDMAGIGGLSGPHAAGLFGQADPLRTDQGAVSTNKTSHTGDDPTWQNDMMKVTTTGAQQTTWNLSSIPNFGSSSASGSLQRYNAPDHSTPSSVPNGTYSLWNTHHVSAHPLQATISEFVLRESAMANHRRTHTHFGPTPTPTPTPIRPQIYMPRPNPIVPSDAIENIFPSADSKRLFHHVRSRTSHIIVAYGTHDGVSKNPFMSLAMDFMLRNVNTYVQTAFRHALLSLAASHAHHESLQATPEQRQQMIVRTVKSRRKALMNMSISSLKDKGDQTDLMLITCLTIHIRDVSQGKGISSR